MGLFSSINTAASGLSAQRLRLDVISDNIANADTTRTVEGGPFRRSRVIFRPRVEQTYWRSPFLPAALQNDVGRGVRVTEIEKDLDGQPRLVYDPTIRSISAVEKGGMGISNVNIGRRWSI
jgi:flagellar basal-body rod protein FlgC